MWQCYHCNYSSIKKFNTESHVEAKHLQNSGFVCPYCQNICSSKKTLSNHISKKHKQVSFWWLILELWNKKLFLWFFFVKLLLLIIRYRRLHSVQNAEDPRGNVAMFVLFPGVQSENQHIWAYWGKPRWDPWLLLWCLFQALSN